MKFDFDFVFLFGQKTRQNFDFVKYKKSQKLF